MLKLEKKKPFTTNRKSEEERSRVEREKAICLLRFLKIIVNGRQ